MPKQKKRPEKKSETLEVRMPHSKKQAFMDACERQGITASEAVRTFVDAYLRRSRRARLHQIAKDIAMKLLDNPLKTTGTMTGLALAAIAVIAAPGVADETYVEPLEPPFVMYPAELVRQGISGECEATFDVTKAGHPEDIVVACTHEGFLEAVKDAVASLEFAPKIVDGQAIRQEDVTYPLVFSIEVDPDE